MLFDETAFSRARRVTLRRRNGHSVFGGVPPRSPPSSPLAEHASGLGSNDWSGRDALELVGYCTHLTALTLQQPPNWGGRDAFLWFF
ncbi:uncharacterized protein HHUB_2924 [Halobacterium hubeiense]|uniref:Uncharacterized protein n=1 Tax=Halobacterium hubeiense TaxID=1407499 RepID=A0A0U5H1S8_9EURY|nr:uncharacterized protein HHUB_2924 [Halobacterium hubeiense]